MKRKSTYLFIIFYLIFLVPKAHAEYVLPYPSYMPGNKIYNVSRMVDTIKKYWYWGSIASLKYHLKLSDKYVVEAKTLFEYKQYLLAVDALSRSDKEFSRLSYYLGRAKTEDKDVENFKSLLVEAAKKHEQIIRASQLQLPKQFTWTPEKLKSTTLSLYETTESSIKVRMGVLGSLSK